MSRELYIFKQRISKHSGTKMQFMSALLYVRLNCILTYCYAPRYKVGPHLNPFSRTGLDFECSSASLHAFRLRIWNVTDPILRQSKVPILCFGTVTISYKVELLISALDSLIKCNWIISPEVSKTNMSHRNNYPQLCSTLIKGNSFTSSSRKGY